MIHLRACFVVLALSLAVAGAACANELAATAGSAEAAPLPSPSAAVPEAFAEQGWGIHGRSRAAYRVVEDSTVMRGGRATLRFASTGEAGSYATFMRTIDVGDFAGKRVRVAMYTRTAGATPRAEFWARTMGLRAARDPQLQWSASIDLPETSDWERRELLVDVQREASKLEYGVGLEGSGSIWIDTPTIELVESPGADSRAAGSSGEK